MSNKGVCRTDLATPGLLATGYRLQDILVGLSWHEGLFNAQHLVLCLVYFIAWHALHHTAIICTALQCIYSIALISTAFNAFLFINILSNYEEIYIIQYSWFKFIRG